MHQYTITDGGTGKRLDHIMPPLLGVSRSQAQKAIKAGAVLLDGKTVTPHVAVKVGQVVTWTPYEETIAVTPNSTDDIPILFEDDDYLVIDKPAGMVVHQATGHREANTVVNWALAHVPFIATVGTDPLRPGIVHRLDRDVSGVLVLAKTPVAFDHLLRLFATGGIEKTYEAIVSGLLSEHDVIVTRPIGRSTMHPAKMAARSTATDIADTRTAETQFTIMNAFIHVTHVRVAPKTGRRHQIRVHAASIGNPIVGDMLYSRTEFHPERAPRLLLHATSLAFVDHAGIPRTYASALPRVFTDFLKKQKS